MVLTVDIYPHKLEVTLMKPENELLVQLVKMACEEAARMALNVMDLSNDRYLYGVVTFTERVQNTMHVIRRLLAELQACGFTPKVSYLDEASSRWSPRLCAYRAPAEESKKT